MARMRAQTYVKQYSTNVINMAPGTSFSVYQLAVGNFPRQLKNIRGNLQFTTGDASPTSVDSAAGWVGLLRYPTTEQIGVTDINLEDPRLLHPVVWNFRLYPGHVLYEFKGINLSQHDKLVLVVHKGLHTGSDNVYIDFVLLWAQLNHPATG